MLYGLADSADVLPVSARPHEGRGALHGVVRALWRLDRRLAHAISTAQAEYGPQAASDPYRGLYIAHEEAERLLARGPGGAPLPESLDRIWEPSSEGDASRDPLTRLALSLGLSPLDMDLLVIALAPELDLRYERLYAYLQDDVTRRRPSADLALQLACASWEATLEARARLALDAPLCSLGLLDLVPDPNHVHPPLLAHYLKPDAGIVSYVLGRQGEGDLLPGCQLVEPAVRLSDLCLDAHLGSALSRLVEEREPGTPLTLYVHGPDGEGQRQLAEALAHLAGAPLLAVDLASWAPHGGEHARAFRHLGRDALLHSAVLFLSGLDSLTAEDRRLEYDALMRMLASHPGVSILVGSRPWTPTLPGGEPALQVVDVPLPLPGYVQRRAYWRHGLGEACEVIEDGALDALAGRFRLSASQIRAAVATARGRAAWRAAQGGWALDAQPTENDLLAAARAHSARDLGTLARKLSPHYEWEDIVLPPDKLRQLREVCNYVRYRPVVYDEWGFDGKLSLGRGLNVLFAGPSGTGKTMAADIIAGDLGLDLYKIDLSTVVSKYIGETEKNLSRIFEGAEASNAVLLFDEADALFGKRGEVRDSHDRYANIEVGYLLQRMEEYDGVVILTTNLRKNMDDAFVRRLHFTLEFPFPTAADRRRIWEGVWPGSTPLSADVHLGFMAESFELTGGGIRNIALAAAFLAAGEGGCVRMEHLIRATRREYQKMGKVIGEGEFGEYAVSEQYW